MGANLGEKQKHLTAAVSFLGERAGRILALSSFYASEPWGFESGNDFLNLALALETSFRPLDLLCLTQEIERDLGRRRETKGIYCDRVIDIDILLYEDLTLTLPRLILPHPLMHLRRFVLAPMVEIAPQMRHPLLKKNMQELLLAIND